MLVAAEDAPFAVAVFPEGFVYGLESAAPCRFLFSFGIVTVGWESSGLG